MKMIDLTQMSELELELEDIKNENLQLLGDLQEIKHKLSMKTKDLEDSILATLADDNRVKDLNNTAIQKESNREDSSEDNDYHDIYCEHCKFKAKSNRGLKTHMGHIHKKDAVKDIVVYKSKVYTCAICEK
jgi:hypothetical protein